MRAIIARTARQAVPPILLNAVLVFCHRLGIVRLKRIWEGQYRTFQEVPVSGPGWGDQTFQRDSVALVRQFTTVTPETPPGGTPDKNRALLALLVAVIRRERGGTVRVVDVGGGAGVGYAYLLRALGDHSSIDYHVIEWPWACEEGARLFRDDRRVHFHQSIPRELMDIDLVSLNGVLEYFDDWKGALKAICDSRPTYVLLTNLCCGSFATYATGFTLVRRSLIPMWILNVHEVVEVMARFGYKLVFKTLLERVLNQDNFDHASRMPGGHPSALLFTKDA